MKYNFKNCNVAVIVLMLLLVGSCTKDKPANQAYIGTYMGNDLLDAGTGGPDYYGSVRILASGVNANKITLFDSIYQMSLAGTISGNNITQITGTTLSLQNGCNNENFTGSGSLLNNILSYTIYGSYSCNGFGPFSDTLSFTGSRQ